MSQNLYEKLSFLADLRGRRPLPDYIASGLRQSFELRPYQVEALADFITYFETEQLRRHPAQTLFHMATGSGKTLIMAGLMLYLYQQGCRDFLFFVNSTNVLEKTRDNFLNPGSSKFLFSEIVRIDGKVISIREVDNFQLSEPDGINICFTTIQGLHMDLSIPREGRMTYADFEERRVVLLSDEAHHINAITKQGASRAELEVERSWESTVARIFASHRENVLLEFTATADLANPAIRSKYEDKIIADYPLARYREDRYSKEIQLLQTDLPPLDRALQAAVLSQYRLKLFQRHGIAIKPVIMLKSKSIKENTAFSGAFAEMIKRLDAGMLRRLGDYATAAVLHRAFEFFAGQGISLDSLAAEMREDFDDIHCLVVDSEKISGPVQLDLNTLENQSNPFRAVFAVDMLNEGWDVLNLFDIVRLHDNRDAKAGKPGRSTMAEAQLIGRGARYCPFRVESGQELYRRKYDDDLNNDLRVCEELYYHSATNSRYIDELRTALRQTGALPEQAVEVQYKLKEAFERSDLYRQGWVFLNERKERNRGDIRELPIGIRTMQTTVRFASGTSRSGGAFAGKDEETVVELRRHTLTLSQLPMAILDTALRRNEQLRFDRLHEGLPNLASMTDFVRSARYLAGVQLTLETREENPTPEQWLWATEDALRQVADALNDIQLEHYGTKEFKANLLHRVIGNRRCYIANPKGDGAGIAQRVVAESLRLDLSKLDWYGYEENYGTTEEKRFLVYFNGMVGKLGSRYDLVLVLRNEGQLAIYDFDTGRPFEPDFLLFLHRRTARGYEQFQVFVEPKGEHLTDKDRWKESLLLSLERDAVSVKKFADDNEYLVWGLPFYTHEPPQDLRRFIDAVDKLAGD